MVISFGLTIPMIFMDWINNFFRQDLKFFIIMFIFDILVCSKSEVDHDNHLHMVLQTIKE